MDSFILQNIRWLSKNVDDLQILVHSLKEKLLTQGLTATWLKNDQDSNIFNIESYNIIEKSSRKSIRRGWCIYKVRPKVHRYRESKGKKRPVFNHCS